MDFLIRMFVLSTRVGTGRIYKDLKIKLAIRYTVRKKQGGTQSTKDNKCAGSGPKSAGAGLRRRNEAKYKEVIPNNSTLLNPCQTGPCGIVTRLERIAKLRSSDFHSCPWVQLFTVFP